MMTPRRIRRAPRALSLLEVLIAMGLFVVAILGLLSALSVTTTLDSVNRETTYVTNAAITEMETVLTDGFADLVTNHHDREFDVDLQLAKGDIRLKPVGAAAKPGKISVVPYGTNADMVLITVSITWASIARTDRTITLQTLRSRVG